MDDLLDRLSAEEIEELARADPDVSWTRRSQFWLNQESTHSYSGRQLAGQPALLVRLRQAAHAQAGPCEAATEPPYRDLPRQGGRRRLHPGRSERKAGLDGVIVYNALVVVLLVGIN